MVTMRTLTAEQVGRLAVALDEALEWRDLPDGDSCSWTCEHDHAGTVRILGDMGLSYPEIEAVLAELNELGGRCDCEVVFYVLPGPLWRPQPGEGE